MAHWARYNDNDKSPHECLQVNNNQNANITFLEASISVSFSIDALGDILSLLQNLQITSQRNQRPNFHQSASLLCKQFLIRCVSISTEELNNILRYYACHQL